MRRTLSAGALEPWNVEWHRCDRCKTKTRVRTERAYVAQEAVHRVLHAKEDQE